MRAWIALALVMAPTIPAAADFPDIKIRGTLRVIAVREEAPEMFSFSPTGEPGLEREMIEGFCHLHGLKLEVVPVDTSDERIRALQRGVGDVIIGIVETEARRKLIDFTREVLPARHIVLTHKPHRVVNTLVEFRAETVGTVKGTSWAQAIADAGVPGDSVEYFADRYALFDALRDGRISATALTISDYTLAVKRYPGLQGGTFVGPALSAGWAVRKQDAGVLAALNEYLDNLRKGGGWNRLLVKYFGEQVLPVLGRARQP